ncbi:MAG: 50S ribosomal protein L17 [Thermoguttaceae bacterium]|nr:50S ribosomal protein L17 [Thermoguttaceae bacterium]MDW8079739.1 L17 family ribosomal protein [Thermoguttaceae bacterium]
MRHRKRGRKLGRNPKHQRALLRSLAVALILTEADYREDDPCKPAEPGRIITTLAKAKEVRPLIERCITIAKRVLPQLEKARAMEPTAPRRSTAWEQWRKSAAWYEWNRTMAPVVAARRHVLKLLHNKKAVRVIFNKLAPRYKDRPGGYTRILKLVKPRLGDNAPRAILEFVGKHDRVKKTPVRPVFESAT